MVVTPACATQYSSFDTHAGEEVWNDFYNVIKGKSEVDMAAADFYPFYDKWAPLLINERPNESIFWDTLSRTKYTVEGISMVTRRLLVDQTVLGFIQVSIYSRQPGLNEET